MKQEIKQTAQTKKVTNVPNRFYEAMNTIHTTKKETKEHIPFMKKYKKLFASLGVAAVLGTTGAVVFSANYAVGYTVKVDNTVVGKVATKDEFYEVLDEVKVEVKDTADIEFIPGGEESFQMEIVSKNDLTEKEELAENLKSTADTMEEGCQILVNGTVFATLPTVDAANNVLEAYLSAFRNETTTAEFADEVTVETAYVAQEAMQTEETLTATLAEGKVVEYQPTEGETVESIALAFGVSEEIIYEKNELTENDEIVGITLKIYTGEPLLSVKTVEHVLGEQEMPFAVQTTEDSTLYEGVERVDVKGKTGKRYVDAYITKVNGAVTEEVVLEERILKEPVTEVKRIGTKERPASVGTGSFVMPTSGKLTSPFGPRWGRNHSGIDVAAKVGTPIYASDNGIVTLSEYKNNGYGNMVMIDHGNGYVTYYAHCSELLVKEGEVVAQGDLIAKMGSTGRSTGSHLHFEIRENGTAMNPMNYIVE